MADSEAPANNFTDIMAAADARINEERKQREAAEKALADAQAEIGRLQQELRNSIGALRVQADALERGLDDSRPV